MKREHAFRREFFGVLLLFISVFGVFGQSVIDEKLSTVAQKLTKTKILERGSTIAVADFTDIDGKSTKLGKFLADEITYKLAETKKFRVWERKRLKEELKKHNLKMEDLVTPKSQAKVGALLGLDGVGVGEIIVLDKELKMSVRLVDRFSGEIDSQGETMLPKEPLEALIETEVPKKEEAVSQKKDTIPEEKKKPLEKPMEEFRQGLTGEHFNLPPFKDNPGILPEEPTLIKIENAIDFDWGGGAPAPSVSADYFGAKWTGMIHIPLTGTYLFRVWHDDGVRLFINDTLLLEYWHPGRYNHDKTVFLEGGGWHSLKVEFFEVEGKARVRLYWRPPGSDKLEVVPSTCFQTKTLERR